MSRSKWFGWLQVVVLSLVMTILFAFGQYIIGVPFVIPILQGLDSLEVFGPKEESRENRTREVQRQLSEIFSPIHFTVMRLNQHLNLENAARVPTQGGLIPVNVIDNWNRLAEIVSNHAYDIGDERFNKWPTFNFVRNAGGDPCIAIDASWAEWFLSLEADFRRLTKELNELTK